MPATAELAERFIETLERRDWEAWAALLHPDVIYELPQSREVIRGRDTYLRFNQDYPGDWHLSVRRIVADDRSAVVLVDWTLGGDAGQAITFLDVDAGGRVVRLIDFWPEPMEPAPGRATYIEPTDRTKIRRSAG